MFQIIAIFTLCSLVNVMLNTVKTIIMYRNEKLSSALINAITYGFYTIVVVLMAGDMALWLKVVLTAVTNFVGVWLSMLILDKLKKDKLWKIEFTTNNEKANFSKVKVALDESGVPYRYNELGKHTVFTCYCATQKDSIKIKSIINYFDGKYFAVEGKSL